MSKVYLICGKIASGKTYYANKLKDKVGGVILSTDEVTYDLIDNEQGEFYDQFAVRVNRYLNKKAVEIVKAGCNVVLDWGFWTKENRRKETEYFTSKGIEVEWHYIDINDDDWNKNISYRNILIEEGKGGCSFYVNEGLKKKTSSLFEIPSKEEIDVWYKFER